MLSVTVREDRVLCAFCKNWYDPTNQYIKPKYPQLNQCTSTVRQSANVSQRIRYVRQTAAAAAMILNAKSP